MNKIALISCLFGSAFFGSAQAKESTSLQENSVVMDDYIFQATRSRLAEMTEENVRILAVYDHVETVLAQKSFLPGDVSLILDCISFAAEKHKNQTRKNREKTPYIVHPLEVALHLMEVGKVRDPEIIMGALLHDTVEDTGTNLEEIEHYFGGAVAAYVNEVTDDKSLPREEQKRLQIEHAPDKSPGAAMIKLGDKWNNISDLRSSPPVNWDQQQLHNYLLFAKKVVDALPDVNKELKEAFEEEFRYQYP